MSLFSTVLVSPHSRVFKESCYSRGTDLCDLRRIWIWDWREMVYLLNTTHDGHMPSLHRHSYLVWYKHHACNPRYHTPRQAPVIMFVNTPTLAERDPLMLTTKLFCPRGFSPQPVLFRVSVSVSVSYRSKLTRDVTLTVSYSRQHVTSI
jgi:hypothetical protein